MGTWVSSGCNKKNRGSESILGSDSVTFPSCDKTKPSFVFLLWVVFFIFWICTLIYVFYPESLVVRLPGCYTYSDVTQMHKLCDWGS